MSWRPIMAIARAELRFGLRRGWPVVGTAAVGLVVSAGTLYLAHQNMVGMPRQYAAEAGAQALAMSWPVFQWLALGVLPMVCAPAVPCDRQCGVDELLRSLPLTGGPYLAGKVVGVVLTVLLTGIMTLVAHLGLHLALVGPVDVSLYLELIGLNGLPLLLWGTTLGVLAGAGLPTRRSAVFVGMVVGALSPYPWGLAFRPPADSGPFEGRLALLSRQATSDFVFQRHGLLPEWVPAVTAGQTVAVLAAALVVLLLAALVARLWLRWREDF